MSHHLIHFFMHFCPIKLRSFFTQVIKNTKTLYLYISCMQFEIYIPVQRLSIFDFLGEKLSELNRTNSMKRCFQEKNFPRQIFLRQKCHATKIPATNFKWQNFMRRRYPAPQFNAAKIPCGKIFGGEISCGGIKRGENFTRWYFLRWNIQQRNLTRRKTPYFLLKR